MQSIRSFIAIPLSNPIRRHAVRLVSQLGQAGDGVKWVPTDNLHLTLKFLGDVANTEVPQICNLMRTVCDSYEPFDLSFAKVGGFPELERARVVYVGIEDPSGKLRSLVADLEASLADLGFKPEPRDYVPHLTLGRTRGGSRRIAADVISRIEQQREVVLGEMVVENMQLIASFLDKKGPSYQSMDTIEL